MFSSINQTQRNNFFFWNTFSVLQHQTSSLFCVFRVHSCMFLNQSWTWTVWRTRPMWGGVSHVTTPPCFAVKPCGILTLTSCFPRLSLCHNGNSNTTGRTKSEQRRKVNELTCRKKGNSDEKTRLTQALCSQPQCLRVPPWPLAAAKPIRRENTLQLDAVFHCLSSQSLLSSCWSIEVWEPPCLPNITQTAEA